MFARPQDFHRLPRGALTTLYSFAFATVSRFLEFPSAVDALSAAIEFQQAMAEANRDEPADTALVFRIGLHLGDLIVDGDDLYGDGVPKPNRCQHYDYTLPSSSGSPHRFTATFGRARVFKTSSDVQKRICPITILRPSALGRIFS